MLFNNYKETTTYVVKDVLSWLTEQWIMSHLTCYGPFWRSQSNDATNWTKLVI